MLGQFNPPMEAVKVAAATMDLMRERQSQLNFVFAREVIALTDPRASLGFSDSVWLARQLIDALTAVVAHGGMTAALDDRLITLVGQLGRDHVTSAFRSAGYLVFGAEARPMVINAWCEVLAACCALSAEAQTG